MADRPVTYPEWFATFLSLWNGFQAELAALVVLDARGLSTGTAVAIGVGGVAFLVAYYVLWWSRGGERKTDGFWTGT